jgi:hypothetical protein
VNSELEIMWKEVVIVLVEIPTRYLLTRTERGHEKPQDSLLECYAVWLL